MICIVFCSITFQIQPVSTFLYQFLRRSCNLLSFLKLDGCQKLSFICLVDLELQKIQKIAAEYTKLNYTQYKLSKNMNVLVYTIIVQYWSYEIWCSQLFWKTVRSYTSYILKGLCVIKAYKILTLKMFTPSSNDQDGFHKCWLKHYLFVLNRFLLTCTSLTIRWKLSSCWTKAKNFP